MRVFPVIWRRVMIKIERINFVVYIFGLRKNEWSVKRELVFLV